MANAKKHSRKPTRKPTRIRVKTAKRKARLHRPDHCPACNKSFTKHKGIVGTCTELQQNRMIMLRMLDDLAQLSIEFAHDLRLSLDAVGADKCKATVATKG